VYRAEGFFGRNSAIRQLDPLRCRITPRTCRILREAGAPPGMVNQLPSLQGAQEVVDFLSADPGTTVDFHAASTNSRLTVQVCLAGCGESHNFVQAGPAKAYYRFGEPVVFDDSFLHRVVIDAQNSEPRWVLSVQVLHPQIDTVEGFAEYFARYKAPPSLDEPRDDPMNGGPVPPPLGDDDDENGRQLGISSTSPFVFHNERKESVLLYSALWGPQQDGPDTFLGEALGMGDAPPNRDRKVVLPPLPHRSRLSVRSFQDGTEIAVWRVDARRHGKRLFVLSSA